MILNCSAAYSGGFSRKPTPELIALAELSDRTFRIRKIVVMIPE
jgi:hypothetical protein